MYSSELPSLSWPSRPQETNTTALLGQDKFYPWASWCFLGPVDPRGEKHSSAPVLYTYDRRILFTASGTGRLGTIMILEARVLPRTMKHWAGQNNPRMVPGRWALLWWINRWHDMGKWERMGRKNGSCSVDRDTPVEVKVVRSWLRCATWLPLKAMVRACFQGSCLGGSDAAAVCAFVHGFWYHWRSRGKACIALSLPLTGCNITSWSTLERGSYNSSGWHNEVRRGMVELAQRAWERKRRSCLPCDEEKMPPLIPGAVGGIWSNLSPTVALRRTGSMPHLGTTGKLTFLNRGTGGPPWGCKRGIACPTFLIWV